VMDGEDGPRLDEVCAEMDRRSDPSYSSFQDLYEKRNWSTVVVVAPSSDPSLSFGKAIADGVSKAMGLWGLVDWLKRRFK